MRCVRVYLCVCFCAVFALFEFLNYVETTIWANCRRTNVNMRWGVSRIFRTGSVHKYRMIYLKSEKLNTLR